MALCLQAEAVQVLVDPFTAHRVDVQRGDMGMGLRTGQFQQVCCFAAGGGTGVQNMQRLGQVQPAQQKRGGHLGPGVLHGHLPVQKARNVLHRPRLVQQDAKSTHGHCINIHSI